MKSEVAIIGLVIGALGVLVAVAIRARWARPLGAALLAVAVVAEIVAVQAHAGAHASGGGHKTLTPLPTGVVTTTSPSTQPTSTATPTLFIPLQLISVVHPGTLAIVKQITVNKEFVRLANQGSIARHLGGWKLSSGTFTYTFPAGTTIAPGGTIILRTGAGTDADGTFHWNLTHYVWPKGGGHITLDDGGGKLIDQCTYAAVSADHPSASC